MMSYSRDTLEKALKLFKNAKSDLNSHGYSTSNLESYLYELRDRPRKPVGGCTATWIDNDESGDYTPVSELSGRFKRPTETPRNSDNQEGTSRKARDCGDGYPITLKLNSPEGKQLLTNISGENLPSDEPVAEDCTNDSSTTWPTLPRSKAKTPKNFESTQSTLSGRRSSRICARSQKTADSASSLLSLAPSIDTSSPSMFVGERTPFTSESPIGLAGGNSNISTPSPSVKRRSVVSRRSTTKRNPGPYNLLAGNRVGPSLGGHTAASSLGDSVSKGFKGTKSGSNGVGRKQVVSEERRAGGKSIILRTRFAHPITFLHVPPKNGSKPCHWCHNFAYGIFGLGDRDVEVVSKPDGSGYIEVHRDQEPSRMCAICTFERIHIGNCDGHTIATLKDLEEDAFDFEKAFRSLEARDKTSRRVQTNPWCSICPNPAFHQCVTLQKFNKFREPLEFGERGCGLLLCSDCAGIMLKCSSDVLKTVEVHKNAQRELRADVDFLLPDNDLLKAL
jgi:hypothetical protein